MAASSLVSLLPPNPYSLLPPHTQPEGACQVEALLYRVFWLHLSPAKSKVAKDSTLNFSGSLLFTASSLPSLPAVTLTPQFLFLPPGLSLRRKAQFLDNCLSRSDLRVRSQ